jgi:hypothetical protein
MTGMPAGATHTTQKTRCIFGGVVVVVVERTARNIHSVFAHAFVAI